VPEKPIEASFREDPATADLSAKVTEAWRDFTNALTKVLHELPAGSRLELAIDQAALEGGAPAIYEASVVCPEAGQLTAYAVGNTMLPEHYRLSLDAIGQLVALGWNPPGGAAGPGRDERYTQQLSQDQAASLSTVLTRTLHEIYRAPHPAFLMYAVHAAAPAEDEAPDNEAPDHEAPDQQAAAEGEAAPAEAGAPSPTDAEAGAPAEAVATGAVATEAAPTEAAPKEAAPKEAAPTKAAPTEAQTEAPAETPTAPVLPLLGAARPMTGDDEDTGLPNQADLSVLPLPDAVATVLAAILRTTPESLPVDNDGDFGIRSGSAMVFIRVREDPPLIDVFSPVLTDVNVSQPLFVRLSELTARLPIGRLYCANNTVWASVPVIGRNFQATHLMLAVQVMTGLADELDDRLHGEFGGKRFFVEADRAATGESAPSTPATGENKDGDDGHTGMYL
jgi:hypothetical protein